MWALGNTVQRCLADIVKSGSDFRANQKLEECVRCLQFTLPNTNDFSTLPSVPFVVLQSDKHSDEDISIFIIVATV